MKKRMLFLMSVLTCAVLVTGCEKDKEEAGVTVETGPVIQVVTENNASEPEEEPEEEEVREGMYRSELTNEWVDEALKNQRPIAAMVDNEKTALPHYGLSRSDIVYEITNSMANDGVTRFMVLFKDYDSVDQIGSIRSTRPTNCQIVPEWNAILCHDGGPFYIDDYIANAYVDHISGVFSRIDNGKSREFTEYITTGEVKKYAGQNKIDIEYNDYYPGPHYQFAPTKTPNDLSQYKEAQSCTRIDLPYKHNKPYMDYDEASGTYLYSEYGQAHVDPGNNNEQLSFVNVILQNARYVVFDDNGYMMFHSIDYNRDGYYITGGKATKITWSKEDEMSPTRYYDENGEEIKLNTGRTYVALIPDDLWKSLKIQ